MELVRSAAALRRTLALLRGRKSIGFVPTMGALHAGHASLIRRARKACDVVVVSIFVNPTQFGPKEDFSRYPRTIAADLALCRKEGADVVFLPSVRAMYPDGAETFIDQIRLPRHLCGPLRPGHFRGVLTVVAKLFNLVGPDIAFFGQKDYQQAIVLRRMARDLDFPVRLLVCPTVREPDGLAMSSRNRYLSAADRRRALALWKALQLARRMVRAGRPDGTAIERAMRGVIRREAPGARIDYAAVADPETLEPLRRVRGKALAALAVRIGKTRLIDNLRV